MTENDKIEIRQNIIIFVGLSIAFIIAVIFSIYTLDNFFNFELSNNNGPLLHVSPI